MADEGGKERSSGRYGESSLGNCPERTKHGRRTEDRRQSKRPHTADDVDDDQAETGVVMAVIFIDKMLCQTRILYLL